MDTINLNPLSYGRSSFTFIREQQMIYVDKTALIAEIAKQSVPLFLSRPRRFGKSLLINTFSSLFADGLKYFNGLEIEKIWMDKTYHVIHLDFSRMTDGSQNLKIKLGESIINKFKMKGIVDLDASYGIRTPDSILNDICEKLENNSIVLLIDEYDAPITYNINDLKELNKIIKILDTFYATIKEHFEKFRFVFITGITRTSHVSMFSTFNNLKDLSLIKDYNSLLGFTYDDLEKYFDAHIENASRILKMNKIDVYQRLQDYYDGYKFSFEADETVYTPWSILSFLDRPQDGFRNYWFQSGGISSFIMNYLKITDDFDFLTFNTNDLIVDYYTLCNKYDITNIPNYILLYQAGYFTIKTINSDIARLILANREVESSLYRLYLLANNLTPKSTLKKMMLMISSAIDNKQLSTIINIFNKILNQCVSSLSKIFNDERSVRDIIYAALTYIPSLRVIKEHDTANGRSDLEIFTDTTCFIVEFKRTYPQTRSASQALKLAIKQVKENRYGIFFTPICNIYRVVMVISTEKKTILQDYCQEVL
ncbi:MAG: AAA family ATPase [Desulfovibrionaceae bacterium]|nr:AAA family ATPase [Desulfovibrionaceae bacterium]